MKPSILNFKHLKCFAKYMEFKFLYCGSTLPNVRRWVKASHIKFEQKLWNIVRDRVTINYGFMKTLRKNLAKRENLPTPCNRSVTPHTEIRKKLTTKALLLGHGQQEGQTRPSHKAVFFIYPVMITNIYRVQYTCIIYCWTKFYIFSWHWLN
jgi:hypothetical protein